MSPFSDSFSVWSRHFIYLSRFHRNKCFQSEKSLNTLLNPISSLLFNFSDCFYVVVAQFSPSFYVSIYTNIVRKSNVIRFKLFEFRKICLNVVAFLDMIALFVVHEFNMMKVLPIVLSLTTSHVAHRSFVALSRVMS